MTTGGDSRYRMSAGLAGQQDPPFVLGQPAPDAVWLTNTNRVLEAVAPNPTLTADAFRVRLTNLLFVLAFEMGRRKEQ